MSHPRITHSLRSHRISPVRIIGVIDLKDGRAVHARGGHRDAYRRVERAAGVAIDGSGPDLARAYIDVFGVEELYVADLNAIGGGTADHDAVSAISRLGVPVMVDAGHQHRARRRTGRRGMEVGEAHAGVGKAIEIRRLDFAAERAEIGKAEIVRDDDEEVGP